MNIIHRLRHRNPDGTCRHSFEPRYDDKYTGMRIGEAVGYSPEEVRDLLFARIYVRDVCRYCGATVERGP